jgi:hypothetical protein
MTPEKTWNRCSYCDTLELAYAEAFKERHTDCNPVTNPTIANRFLVLKNLFRERLHIEPASIEIQRMKNSTKIVFWFNEKTDSTLALPVQSEKPPKPAQNAKNSRK